jgi:hypothetical protein
VVHINAAMVGTYGAAIDKRHLYQVCQNHGIKISKKDPGISDLNNILKDASVLDIPQWRSIQYLADIRNLCDHNKKVEPTIEQVNELVAGVKKATKTLF